MKEGVQRVGAAAFVALALPSVPLTSTFNVTPLAILPEPSQGVGQKVCLVKRTHETVVLKLWVTTPLEVAYQISIL